MRLFLRHFTTGLGLLLLTTIALTAQEAQPATVVNHHPAPAAAAPTVPADSYRIEKGSNEWGVWAGGAFNATTAFGGITEAEARDRKLLLVGLRYARTFAATESVTFQYTLDVLPVAVAFNSEVARGTGAVRTLAREHVYGFGAAPLGLQVNFGQRSRVKPFVAVSGGGIIFRDPVPLADGSKFVFTGDGSAGVRVFADERSAWSLGVKLHHISNGDRSGSNRGLNSFVFFAGYSIFR